MAITAKTIQKCLRNAIRGYKTCLNGINTNWELRQNPIHRQNIREWIARAKQWEASILEWGRFSTTVKP